MLEVIVPIIFVALAINIPTMIAYLIGLQFQIEDKNCPQEVRDVKRNILLTKLVQVFNVVLLIAIMILCHL